MASPPCSTQPSAQLHLPSSLMSHGPRGYHPPLATVSGTWRELSLWTGTRVAGHLWLKLTGQVETTGAGEATWKQELPNAVGKEAWTQDTGVGWEEL